ncbi:MAG: CapA family protein, partial [Bryobacteraceae bacterium]
QPAIVTANGIRIAFVGASYSSLNDLGVARNPNVARIEDHDRLRRALAGLHARADFVVVTLHAGNEYTHKPNQAQIAFAHAAVDAGADLVVGAHSHWVQAFDSYKGKPVFYGLGNFVFDQDWSRETTQGLALRIRLAKLPGAGSATLERIELLPVVIEHASTPRPANEREGQAILHAAGLDVLEGVVGGRRGT